MVGTEFIDGQGLGNQLFCYVTARAVAEENGYDFGTAGQERFAVNIHSDRGMYFMDVDLGSAISEEEKKNFQVYHDVERRLYIGNSRHDLTHGCYVAGAEPAIHHVADNTLIYGNMQDESYFIKYLPKLREWLKVKPEYDSYEYSRENLCVINMRGGEYTGSPELLLNQRYWLHGIREMKRIRPDMEFVIITDDVKTAQKLLPGIEAHHFDIGKDYVTLKNAHYLLLSNSSFACLPAHTSETLKFAIAPKYWARHNVSDGYWASEQNIYSLFHYMDRKGRIFTAEECREELERYKQTSRKYAAVDVRPVGIGLQLRKLHAWYCYKKAYLCTIARGVRRRVWKLTGRTLTEGSYRDGI
ncbi:MAG: glycosyl transferase [Clostridiales bacterium]|nr:glycosyl transferase [Clostridiales bacterium]